MSQYAKTAATMTSFSPIQLVAGLFDPSRFAPELRAFGLSGPRAVLASLKNFAITVWDPAKSDIRQGINVLIEGALRDPKPGALEDARRGSPASAVLWEERYDPVLDLDSLATLPDGTLGREYARFVRDNGIEPLGNQVEWGEAENLLQYQLLRAYKLHDVLHVVLGCPATPLGEVPIVAFSVGQASTEANTAQAAAIALAVVLLHIALRRTGEFAEACRLTGEWTRIGERCRPYTEHRFEELMGERVEAVRERVLAGSGEPTGQARFDSA